LILRRELSRTDQKVDLALLQLERPDALSNAFALDISFRALQEGSIAYAMGYSGGDPKLNKRSVEVEKITEQDGYVVKGDPYPGDSGSPLISQNGMVVAIGRAKVLDKIAYYTPLLDAISLLKMIPSTTRMTDLDERIRKKTIDQSELSSNLRPGRSQRSARNVELVSWATAVNGNSPPYREVKALFDCPIVMAFWHRTLDPVADLFRPVMTAAQALRTDFLFAETAAALKRTWIADARFKQAVEKLTFFDTVPSWDDPPPRLTSSSCDPAAFFALFSDGRAPDEKATTAFLFTATKGQYEQFSKQAGGSLTGLTAPVRIGFSNTSYSAARDFARKETAAQALDNPDLKYADLLAQKLTPDAAELYSKCISFEASRKREFRVWPAKREGDRLVYNVLWYGDGTKSEIKPKKPQLENFELVTMPSKLSEGVTKQIVLKKQDPTASSSIEWSVGGQTIYYFASSDRPIVSMANHLLAETNSVDAGSFCQPFHPFRRRPRTATNETCVVPQKKGGFLVPSSGQITMLSQAGEVSREITVNTPERICARLAATSRNCAGRSFAAGRLVATERYPATQLP
jgi:hypothetical protein